MQAGDIVGSYLLNERTQIKNRPYWDCTCKICGKSKYVREDSLKSGKTVSDGCYKKTPEFVEKIRALHPVEDLTGRVFYELTVLHLAETRKGKSIMWTCRCSCGRIVDVAAGNLKNGNSKTCGDYFAHRKDNLEKVWDDNLEDLTDRIYGDWYVKCRDGYEQPTRWICVCQNCGTEKSVLGSSLKKGQSKSCGCRRHNESLVGQKIGHWFVKERSKRKRPNGHFCTTYLCVCECGTERYVDETRLLNGKSLSCGCYNSKGNEYISNYLAEKQINFSCEYSYPELKGPNNGLLRFDFAIQDKDDNVLCLIEFQGQQHYTTDDFGRMQREITDPKKKKFCKQNNIPLYEIKYTDNIDAKLDKILSHITC